MTGVKLSSSLFSSGSFLHVLRTRSCIRHTLRSTRAFHVSSASAEQEKSFRGQLYQSTAQRLERERAEQRRFAHERGEGNNGRSAAFTFGLILQH